MLNSFQHLMPVSLGNKEIPNQVRNDGRVCAFTLAEVLITLVIIGVVAALTIPNLMQSWTKQALKSELKKAYSEINNVSQKFTSDKGITFYEFCKENPNKNGTPQTEILPKELTKYMKIDKYSPRDITKDDAGYLVRDNVTALNKNIAIRYTYFDDGYFKDNRGREWFFDYVEPQLTVDLNGLNKGPNRFGYDIFTFQIKKDNQQLVPYQNASTCDLTSTHGLNGIGCAYYALYDVSPTDKNQTYWEDFLK